jgi:gamma-glutamyltranspeptidase
MKLLLEFGTLRVEDVLAPAIHYAGGGYPAPERQQVRADRVERRQL